MLAGLVEQPDSSQLTRMNREFMPTDLSGCRYPLHFMKTKMARRVRWHSQVLMSHIYGRDCRVKPFHPNRLAASVELKEPLVCSF